MRMIEEYVSPYFFLTNMLNLMFKSTDMAVEGRFFMALSMFYPILDIVPRSMQPRFILTICKLAWVMLHENKPGCDVCIYFYQAEDKIFIILPSQLKSYFYRLHKRQVLRHRVTECFVF